MSDLISRRAAIKAIDDLPNCYNGYSDTYDKAYIIGVLDELPSIDPVKHGKWVSDGYTWRCSECGKTYWGRLAKPWNYCPNCGAKVKEEKGEI